MRSGRGAVLASRPVAWVMLPLAAEKVSQGGPAMMPAMASDRFREGAPCRSILEQVAYLLVHCGVKAEHPYGPLELLCEKGQGVVYVSFSSVA